MTLREKIDLAFMIVIYGLTFPIWILLLYLGKGENENYD